VLATGDRGEFEFETDQPRVWIVVPRGYACPEWHQRAAPELTFVLEPAEQADWPRLGQLTDLHICDPAAAEVGPRLGLEVYSDRLATDADLLALAREVAAHCDVVVATGDLTDHGTEAEYARFHQWRRQVGKPVLVVPGNHDHYGALYEGDNDAKGTSPDVMTVAYPRAYEDLLEPRWWARWHGNLLLIGLDWFTYHLRLDVDRQDAWLDALLSRVPPDTHVVLLSHDVFPQVFYEALTARWPGLRLRGSLSGHWHVSRVVRHGPATHLSSAPAGFAGLDLTPAHARLVRWSADELVASTLDLNRHLRHAVERDAPIAWEAGLPGVSHLGRTHVDEQGILVTTSSETAASGWVSAIDPRDGRVVWQTGLPAQVRSGAACIGGTVVAVGVGGLVTGLDRVSGRVVWQRQSGDPFVRALIAPLGAGADRVFFGDLTRFEAIDPATGAVVWCRDDIGRAENLLTYGRPAVSGGSVVVPFGGPGAYLTRLDAATGATIWSVPGPGDIPTSDPIVVGDEILVAYAGGQLRRHSFATGEVVGSLDVGGGFPSLSAVSAGSAGFVSLATGRLLCVDHSSATVRWETPVSDTEVGLLPYCRGGAAFLAPPIIDGDEVITLSADGRISRLTADTGRVVASRKLNVLTTADLATCGELLLAVARPGTLFGVERAWS
jgi:outer membrane protein assembly factor BamB/predicted MPP superfamily phosphohydrolase